MEERLGINRVREERFDRGYPPGYRFCPTDLELIYHYLLKKNLGHPLPPNIIGEVEFYSYSPDELVSIYHTMHGTERDTDYSSRKKKECYFFTSRDRKYKNGQRPARKAGNGYWKATGADHVITDENGSDTGWVKKSLVYYKGAYKVGSKTNWILHEYRLKETEETKTVARSDGNMRLDGWVLCRMYEKVDKKGKKDGNDSNPNEVEDEETNEIISNEAQDGANPTNSNDDDIEEWEQWINFVDFEGVKGAICTEDGGENKKSEAGLTTAGVNHVSATESRSYPPGFLVPHYLPFDRYSGGDEISGYEVHSSIEPPSQDLSALDHQPELTNSLTELQALGSHERNQLPRGLDEWARNGLFWTFQTASPQFPKVERPDI